MDKELTSFHQLNAAVNAKLTASHNNEPSKANRKSNNLDAQWGGILKKKVPTAITDAGVFASCGQAAKVVIIFTCERYSVADNPFVATSRKFDKVFAMVMCHTDAADKVKLLRHNVRGSARNVHTFRWYQP